jgi:carbon storage regulator
MLVLSRSKGDAVTIGQVIVEVVEIRGDKVRLGVTAPDDVPVHRREVHDAIVCEISSPTELRAPVGDSQRVLNPSSKKGTPLILSRRKNESIVINNDITVVVVEIRVDKDQSKVRLGVEAPKEVPVHRKEVWDAIMRLQDEPSAEQKSN